MKQNETSFAWIKMNEIQKILEEKEKKLKIFSFLPKNKEKLEKIRSLIKFVKTQKEMIGEKNSIQYMSFSEWEEWVKSRGE